MLPLSDAATPKWKSSIKLEAALQMDKLQAKINKKYFY
jgi:hypothetical protein